MSHNDDLLQAALQQIATLSSRLDSTLELVQSLSNEVISLKSVESQRKLQSGVTTISSLNSGDTAWMLTSTALVLFMSIPGLALYYGGMTREKNVLSTTMQTDEALKNDFSVYGDASRFWLQGMHLDSYHINAPTIPEAFRGTYGISRSLFVHYYLAYHSSLSTGTCRVFYGSTLNGGTQLALQLYAVVISVFWSGICTSIIMVLLDYTIGVRVSLEVEEIGLDFSHHRANLSSSSLHTYTSDKLGRS
eukprot:gene22282-23388_t